MLSPIPSIWKFSLLVTVCMPSLLAASELQVGKICPVLYQQEPIGHLVFSKVWYHSGRSEARYIPGDNATGIGLEIHLKNNFSGKTEGLNIAGCDRYRLVQIRETNARLLPGEKAIQIDVPDDFTTPFYDSAPLEHGYGLHQTPPDSSDKPWEGTAWRDSAVAIYDTPYVSDGFGTQGENLRVSFETCAICERDRQYDTVLSCGRWGYQRDYLDEVTGWTEPEFLGVSCSAKPSETFTQTLNGSNRLEYSYWINWR